MIICTLRNKTKAFHVSLNPALKQSLDKLEKSIKCQDSLSSSSNFPLFFHISLHLSIPLVYSEHSSKSINVISYYAKSRVVMEFHTCPKCETLSKIVHHHYPRSSSTCVSPQGLRNRSISEFWPALSHSALTTSVCTRSCLQAASGSVYLQITCVSSAI